MEREFALTGPETSFAREKAVLAIPGYFIPGHMDEVGLIVQTIMDDGLIRFHVLGGWWAHTLLAKRVRIRTRGGMEIAGVIGAKPPHFLSEAEREKVMKIEDMFIDVGARDAGEVQAFGIRLGDPIVPDSPFVRMHNPDLLLSKAFDDRAGLSLVVHAALETDKMSHPNTIIFAGTVQEEVGTRGAKAAASSANPDLAIVIEGAPADDLPGTSKQERQAAIGSGPQIRFMDSSAIMNREFTEFVIETAEKNGIPYQLAVRRNRRDRCRTHPPARFGGTHCGCRRAVALHPYPQYDNRHLRLFERLETHPEADRNH